MLIITHSLVIFSAQGGHKEIYSVGEDHSNMCKPRCCPREPRDRIDAIAS